jgi:hypothetical protein
MNTKLHIAICTLFLALFAAITSQAATITVTTNNDIGAGSLRQAIADAAANDTIDFAANVRGKIILGNGQLTIPIPDLTTLTIRGPGANLLSIESLSASRIILLTQSGTLKMSGLRIARGNSGSAAGGGIRGMETAHLILESCWITENLGGGIFMTGGNSDTLKINNSIISGNRRPGGTGGIEVGIDGGLEITNSTISDNTGANGGIFWFDGTVKLTNVTISGNRGTSIGGILINNAVTTILNSTITDNGNVSPLGSVGGLKTTSATAVTLKNTIIAKNLSSTAAADVGGIVVSQGNNLIGDTTGGSGFIASDLLNLDPLLGSLTSNGGATYTHSLLLNSPAINAGNNANSPATDQRGVARPQGGTVDIGSYESGVNSPPFGKIVFVIGYNNNSEIYSMNADFTNQIQLTNNSSNDSAPKWSPDGTKILFQSTRDDFFSEIYTMNADGSNPVRLTNNSIHDQYPDWSPDGSKVVFVRGNSLPSEIWTMDSNGLNQVQITGSATNSLLGETEPSWSPDGSRIAFSANPNSGESPEIYVMNADGTNQNRLTFDPATDLYPVWSPDGNSIAYTNNSSGAHTNILDIASLSIQIVSNPNNPEAYAPAWSPDGTKLAHYDSLGNIYIIDAAGVNIAANFAPEGIIIAPQLDWFGFNTETGTNVTANLGTTLVTFSGVSNAGTTTVVPINPTTAGNIPGGYSLGAGFPAFEITTTAAFTAPITVCLQVPSVTNAVTFNALTLFHGEGGVLIDRTVSRNFATKTICASVNSLSPFVVAQNLAPSAANVSIGGRVADANGNAVSRVRISITDQNGETRFVTTGSFGFYRFTEIPAGQTYVISATHKRFQFNSQVISVSEDIQNADFTAEP